MLTSTAVIAGILIGTAPAMADFTIGVMAPRGGIKASKRWQPLAKYLAEQTGEKVKLMPVKPDRVLTAVKKGTIDVVLANPLLSATIVATVPGSKPVAGLRKKSGDTFAGVIFSKAGSGIKTSADVKGKKVLGFKIGKSAGAYLFQAYHLKLANINIPDDLASIKSGKSQDAVVLAVNIGVADVGFVRTGILESMAKEGKVKLADFTIVDGKTGPGGLVSSTDYYPEWQLITLPQLDAARSAKIGKAALGLKASSPAAKAGKIVGFVAPADLTSVIDMMKALKIKPFNK